LLYVLRKKEKKREMKRKAIKYAVLSIFPIHLS
jgi:hypothetical protein